MKKLMILGKNGQLGNELCAQASSFRFALTSYSKDELDVTDYKKVAEQISLVKPDIIMNTTAYHVLSECEKFPQKAFAVNAFALKHLAEQAQEHNATLLTYSTDYVFDGSTHRAYREDDETNPLQVYGLSKLAGEIICRNHSKRSIIIRTCGLYGGLLGSPEKGGNFVLNILAEARTRRELEVSSEQVVSPTYAVDLAAASLKLISIPDVTGGVYHLVSDGSCSWADFANAIVRLQGLNLKIILVDRKGFSGGVRRPIFSALENVRAKHLGIALPFWQDAVSRYLATLR